MTLLTTQKTITSRELSELSGKNHSHVMEAIRKMESAWEKEAQSKFRLSSYSDASGRLRPQYELTKTESLFIISKFDDAVRARLVLRWQKLETNVSKKDLALMIVESEERAERLLIENQTQKETIEENRPKVAFANSVSSSDDLILIRDFAKLISDDDFVIGQNRLFNWFRDNGYLMKNNEPYQQYIDRGYFKVIERTVGSPGSTKITKTTKITGKGQVYFAKKIRGLDAA